MNKYSSTKLPTFFIAVGIFILAGVLYFLPSIQGKTLSQGDVTQFKGSASEIQEYRDQGRDIYWTNVMFAGMPNYAISVVDSGNWIRFIPAVFVKVLTGPIGLFVLLCIGFYVLMMSLNIDARIAIAASLAYALSSYFIEVLAAGHNSKFHAMAYMPGILAGMIWAYQRGKPLLGAAVFGLFTALELNARHPQMFYYFSFVLVLVGIYELVRAFKMGVLPQFLKSTALLLGAALIAIGTQFAYLNRTLDYSKLSTRGQSELSSEATDKGDGLDTDYITNWSYGVAETFSWLVPNYKGGVSQAIGPDAQALDEIDGRFKQAVAGQSQYYGDQPFVAGPAYFGVAFILLAFFGLFFLKNGLKIPLLIGLVLMTMLSWGKNFPALTNFFIENMPMYDKFRAVSSIMVIPSLLVPLLGAMALDKILKKPETFQENSGVGKLTNQKLFYIVGGLLVAFCLISYVAPSTFNSFLSEREAEQLPNQLAQAGFAPAQADQFMEALITVRQAIFKKDVGRTLLLLLLTGGLILLWHRKAIKGPIFVIGVGLIMVADLWLLDRRYLSSENFVKPNQTEVAKSAADVAILQDKDPNYRVLNLTVSPFNDATTSFFHKSVGGYSGIKLKKYQELVDYYLQAEIQTLIGQLRKQEGSNPQDWFARTPVLNMLNTKYVIVNKQGQPLQNPQRNGNAWFVENIQTVQTADEEINALGAADLKTTAVIRQDQLEKMEGSPTSSSGTIQLTSYDPEKLTYTSNSDAAGLAVFSEVYYPEGWKVLVDGNEVPMIRANYVLRAAKIPAGNHQIEMIFEKSFATANIISAVSCLLLIGLLITAVVVSRKKREEATS